MRVALIHDYIKEYGGAERVLEALHEIYPQATVYTTVCLPKFLGPHKERFKDWKIITSWFQKIPYVEKLISPLRILTPWVFENIDLRDFDLVITSATGAYFPNLIVRRPETIHICYCHTPPRYLYGYPTARNWTENNIVKFVVLIVNHWLRQIDFVSYQRPDYIIANSQEVKRRINIFYRREAIVIYPPVDIKISNFKLPASPASLPAGMAGRQISNKIQNLKSKKQKEYYLSGGRLARAKRIDLAIEACNRLKLPLKIFGRGFVDYGRELFKLAGSTVEFLGEVSEEELINLYRNAKALIFPSEQEDFGIIPVEAQACGTPVIALNQGGVKETVIDARSASSGQGPTGVLLDEANVESLIRAIKSFEKLRINREDCEKNAEKFNKERFGKEMISFINSKLKSQNAKPKLKD